MTTTPGYTAALAKEAIAPPMRAFTERDHPSGAILKQAHEAFQQGDLEALFGMMTDDCAWHMPGESVLSGTFVGREEILTSFQRLQENVDAYWAHPLDYFGSDDHVCLVAQVHARRGDKVLDVKECLLWRLNEEGKLAEVWHLALDQDAWDAFFAKD